MIAWYQKLCEYMIRGSTQSSDGKDCHRGRKDKEENSLQPDCIESLFKKLNEEMQEGLPFLGGMKLRFEIVQPRPEALRNRFKREHLEI